MYQIYLYIYQIEILKYKNWNERFTKGAQKQILLGRGKNQQTWRQANWDNLIWGTERKRIKKNE